ncbi:hypothetical protein PENARI_c003G10722 [Penicillium arizonense]|uniref:AN1-type domain-containing protein n=1 Tax=Penicillium arizonense TaxID=1835702 RepID=A0A1F5LT01_PENAI|nr:hypothetical protein PENARI_c003G10722 [Penicillium arizonense]OGE56247.1 hypothetical protein PENARI_c003G10722 [Penicillium arizonense]
MPPRKPRCNFKECKEAAQRIVGDCSFCAGHFCSKHRMLEAHSCSGLEDCKKESHARNADKLNSERTVVVKGMGLSPRLHPILISNSVTAGVASPSCLFFPVSSLAVISDLARCFVLLDLGFLGDELFWFGLIYI